MASGPGQRWSLYRFRFHVSSPLCSENAIDCLQWLLVFGSTQQLCVYPYLVLPST